MIEVKNVKKKFDKDFYANKGISLQAKDGEIIGILRTKWSGKNHTT